MLHDDSDDHSTSSSSEEDDLDFLLLNAMFPPKTVVNALKLNLEDVSEDQCERMFR